jgi:hypothetical protein
MRFFDKTGKIPYSPANLALKKAGEMDSRVHDVLSLEGVPAAMKRVFHEEVKALSAANDSVGASLMLDGLALRMVNYIKMAEGLFDRLPKSTHDILRSRNGLKEALYIEFGDNLHALYLLRVMSPPYRGGAHLKQDCARLEERIVMAIIDRINNPKQINCGNSPR